MVRIYLVRSKYSSLGPGRWYSILKEPEKEYKNLLTFLPQAHIFFSSEMLFKILKKTTYDPTIPLLSIYPEKTIIEKETCSSMFFAAVFTLAGT